eukprot:GHRQ01034106.1.p1 GENE.GHRQ01034106.1~~GHRQ01034106.1.p1  ORF type:complete len:148 (+),score=32.41 GHRQ01034106.1:504-947(+)
MLFCLRVLRDSAPDPKPAHCCTITCCTLCNLQTAMQIMYDVFLQRTGSPLGGIILFALFTMVGVYTCSMSSLTYAARILFSYGRDQLVPCAGWWGAFHKRTRTPQNAVWGATCIAILLGLPMLGSSVAFESLLSLSTIALYVLYAGG